MSRLGRQAGMFTVMPDDNRTVSLFLEESVFFQLGEAHVLRKEPAVFSRLEDEIDTFGPHARRDFRFFPERNEAGEGLFDLPYVV